MLLKKKLANNILANNIKKFFGRWRSTQSSCVNANSSQQGQQSFFNCYCRYNLAAGERLFEYAVSNTGVLRTLLDGRRERHGVAVQKAIRVGNLENGDRVFIV